MLLLLFFSFNKAFLLLLSKENLSIHNKKSEFLFVNIYKSFKVKLNFFSL